MAHDVAFETWISARTSAATGTTTTVATKYGISAMALWDCDELLVYLQVTQAMTGTSPTTDIYLQRPVVPNADPTVAAHWDDLYHFTQFGTIANEEVTVLPIPRTSSATAPITGDIGQTRQTQVLAGDTAKNGHWGDRIRIVEVTGGTITQNAIYNLHARGVRFA